MTKNNKARKGDILYSRVGAKFGEAAVIERDFEFSIYVSLTLIKIKQKNDCYYVKHLLNSEFVKTKAKRSVFQGAGVPNLNVKVVREFVLPFPLLPEQQKIAEILTTADEKIDVIEAQIVQTQELKKGLMQRLLTKGIGHTVFKASPLGEIPQSWDVVTISSVGNVVTGNTPSTVINEYYTEDKDGFLWASPADLGKGKYVRMTNKRLSQRGFDQTRKLSPKSILVTCIGSTIGKIGMADKIMATNQQINSLVCNPNNDPQFFYYALQHKADYIKSLAGTHAVPLLNKTDFSNITVVKPMRAEQEKIGEILCSVEEKLEVLQEKKVGYHELKKGLMQQLLTGKIRVNHLIETEIFA